MKIRCVLTVLALCVMCVAPLSASADASASPALIRATKPVVARDLQRRQQQEAKHHGRRQQCRDHAQL